jgi:membrane-associated phospholipid phosphatase
MAGLAAARRLYAVDLITVAFAAATGLAAVACGPGQPETRVIGLSCGAIVVGVPVLAWLRAHLDVPVLRFLHDWSFALTVYPTYRAAVLLTKMLHGGRTWDDTLIAADRWVFGTDPTVWLQHLATPVVTDILQLAYGLFYVMFLVVGAEAYRTDREGRYREWVFLLAFGFYVSYVGYLCWPSVGPRFTLHDYHAIDRELPGLWLSQWLRPFIDQGGLVPADLQGAALLRAAPTDAFPSGHTMMTVMGMAWSWHRRLSVRWIVWPIGILLIAGTIYLRYHYVVDVLAGASLAALCLAVGPALHRRVAEAMNTIDAHTL